MGTKLRLGDIIFENFEIPQELNSIGGVQQLEVTNLVGPGKVVQVLGPKPHPISWKGVFLYTEAVDKVLRLNQYRLSGKVYKMTWSVFAFNVIVKEFKADPKHEHEIPYEITLEVVEDLTGSVGLFKKASADEGALNAMNRADASLENLASNSNFAPVALSSGRELPDDAETINTYLKSKIVVS